uniref:hypothetical protein n=1 Tax=Mycoplasmopsis bovis TaxID=28903 RepID=UPI003D27937A
SSKLNKILVQHFRGAIWTKKLTTLVTQKSCMESFHIILFVPYLKLEIIFNNKSLILQIY